MDLNTIWFILVTVLFIGFFFLEGFDYGVGILLPFLGKKDEERRAIINTIGPVWDGNEVWMLTAGGAMFASFPHVYATLFSGFYLALILMLVALILRGVAFEYRQKFADKASRERWDWAIFIGSALPALLWVPFLHGVRCRFCTASGAVVARRLNWLLSRIRSFAGLTICTALGLNYNQRNWKLRVL